MNFFSYDQIAGFVIILLALAASFVMIGNCVELVRKWIGNYKNNQQERDNKIDYLKNQTTQHRNDYRDVANLKTQVGKIEENVSKIDKTLDRFIEGQETEMKLLNEETALQTGAIKSLLDHAIDNNHNKNLEEDRKKIDDFLIHRGR